MNNLTNTSIQPVRQESLADCRVGVSDLEHVGRIDRLRKLLEANGLNAFCVFGSVNIFYLTGFAHIQTERPIALVVPRDGETFALVPSLEEEAIQERKQHISKIYVYREYPGTEHPMLHLRAAMSERGLADARLGVDSDGYGSIWGYQGPALSQLLPSAQIIKATTWLAEMRRRKSPGEIALLKESAKLGNLAHGFLQESVRPGKLEIEISMQAARKTTQVMLRMFGKDYVSKRWNASPAFAYLISGPKTSLPHALPAGRKLEQGDVLITSCSAEVGGYMAEMERTLFVGPPTHEQVEYFNLMLEARERAFEAITPGETCAEVDKTVADFFRSAGRTNLTRHHVGHALGLEPHEAPFLDEGDETVIEPGMVFSVEPGLYVQGVGGFRHSDTVVVTEGGAERITYYPTDLEYLTVKT